MSDGALRYNIIATENDVPIICDSDQVERRRLLGFGRRLRVPDNVPQREWERVRLMRAA
jgi:hypothetical protein